MEYESRIRNAALRAKVIDAEQAASLIKADMTVGFSGFTATGYPKLIPQTIAAQGTAKNITVIAGASAGDELDGSLARAGLVRMRVPFNVSKDMRTGINNGTILFADQHLGILPEQLRTGFWGKIDYAVIECCAITEEGGIIPTLSGGSSQVLCDIAEHVILELNLSHSAELEGMHDFFSVGTLPNNNLLPVQSPAQHLGRPYVTCDPAKIEAVVIADDEDQEPRYVKPDEVSQKIADNIIRLLENEIRLGRLPENITIQSGFGAVGNSVLFGLGAGNFKPFNVYTEVLQDGGLDLLLNGKVNEVSVCALCLSREYRKRLYAHLDELHDRVVIRPQDISNNGAIIQRLGVVAMNTALEADIYGNINSTHVMGTSMMNGIGGSGDFARHGKLSIFLTPSTAKKGAISSIVPMVTHVDHTEHDTHVLITEHGIADLRGKAPTERAELIIENCCDPQYRPALRNYFEDAKKVSKGQHTPHDLKKAFSWHIRYMETGDMRETA